MVPAVLMLVFATVAIGLFAVFAFLHDGPAVFDDLRRPSVSLGGGLVLLILVAAFGMPGTPDAASGENVPRWRSIVFLGLPAIALAGICFPSVGYFGDLQKLCGPNSARRLCLGALVVLLLLAWLV